MSVSNPARPWRAPLIGALAVFAAVLGMCLSLDYYRFVGDDGGITLRYAERIASGLGFGYNDGEAVNGCSNPLYTLAVAGLLKLGLSLGGAATWAGSLGASVASGLLYFAFARWYSWLGGLLSVAALISFDYYFYLHFTGLECAFIPMLAAGLFLAIHEERPWLIGACLGLLVANKLDGALAAIAFTLVMLARSRRFPLREALWALAFAAPVFIVLMMSFGSILPNSMSTKLIEHESVRGFDRLWMHRMLMGETRWIYAPALATVIWAAAQRGRGWPTAVLVVQIWLVSALALFAAVDLGAPFPWYASAPQACSTILAAYGACRLSGLLRGSGEASMVRRFAGHGLTAAAAVGLVVANWGTYVQRHGPQSGGLPRHEIQDLGRQAAGAWLAKHTDRTELLAVAYGLPALEYQGPVLDLAGLNSRRDRDRFRAAEYFIMGPVERDQPLKWIQGGRLLLGTFQYDASVPSYWVYGRGDSQIASQNLRHLTLPLPGSAEVMPSTWRRNLFLVMAASEEALSFAAPGAPTVKFSTRRKHRPIPFEVLLDDEVVYRSVAGPEALVHGVVLPRRSEGMDVQRFALTFRVLHDDPPAKHGAPVIFEGVQIQVGEMLGGDDLRLQSRRRAARLEEAADGMPWQRFQP